ncbi:MAG: penicillin-binding protein activator [Oligoflexia bacterium]|nr:penicillin-binding protein activator [Oligoflexia bacterium]
MISNQSKIATASALLLLSTWLSSCTTPTGSMGSASSPSHPPAKRASVSPIDSPISSTDIAQSAPPAQPNQPALPPAAVAAPKTENQEYNELRQVYLTQKCGTNLTRFEQFEQQHPKSPILSQIENLHGLCLLNEKDSQGAIAHFKNAIAENAASPAYQPYLLYNLAKAQFEAGLVSDAAQTLGDIEKIGESSLDTENRAKLALLKSAIEARKAQTEIERGTIGILLPLKGKYGRFGQRALLSIELALGIFGPQPPSGLTLVLEDSGETPEQALRALNRLVVDHHVSAVIGPMLSKGIDQVTQRADELGVPLLSLAHLASSEHRPDSFTVQAGVTSQLQAKEVARYAIQTLGLRKFAVLFPRGKAGEESAQSFWDAVDELGGSVTGYESYAPDETDFRQVVDKISGLYYTEARQRELDQLAKLRTENKIKKRTRKTEQYFTLPPIADYQAVFIPDEPKVAAMLMPTFAYRDVDHVTFLGPSSWNSPELATSAQNYAEGSLFVDAFFPQGASTPKIVKRFVDNFQTEFSQAPTEMEAVAYDAAKVLESAFEAAGKSYDRKDLLNNIRNTKELEGITGKLTYKDGQLERPLKVLSLHNGQIVEDSKL